MWHGFYLFVKLLYLISGKLVLLILVTLLGLSPLCEYFCYLGQAEETRYPFSVQIMYDEGFKFLHCDFRNNLIQK